MNKEDKILSLLGLAARARKIISGEELVIKAIQQDKVSYVIFTTDASENTRKKLIDKCTFYDIPYKEQFDRDQLGHAIGKFSRVVVGITDEGFAIQFGKLFE